MIDLRDDCCVGLSENNGHGVPTTLSLEHPISDAGNYGEGFVDDGDGGVVVLVIMLVGEAVPQTMEGTRNDLFVAPSGGYGIPLRGVHCCVVMITCTHSAVLVLAKRGLDRSGSFHNIGNWG